VAKAFSQVATTASPAGNGQVVDATHGAIAWGVYGGDTYIVEAVGLGASGTHSTTGLDTTDYVVKLTGVVDLTTATFSSHALSV